MNKQEHLLVVFSEEIGELAIELMSLQKQVHKALRFGIHEQRDLPTSNFERIESEWQDLIAAMDKLKSVDICLTPDLDAIRKKHNKIDEYCDYAIELGVLYDAE